MNLASPFCAHIFTESVFENEDGEALDSFTCGCGYTYRLTDLQKFDKLQAAVEKSKANLADHVKVMAAFSRGSKPAAADNHYVRPAAAAYAEPRSAATISAPASAPVAASGSYSTPPPRATSSAPAPQKVKEPVIRRARIRISPQQWLILGASILVLVAASIFVANNLYKMPRYEFLMVTSGVALVTGFGARFSRAISVLLSNFLAAFSATMIFFSFQNIGVYIFGGFEWNTAPPWFLSLNFGAITLLAYLLARISRNFGWKGIALLAWLGAGFSLTYGPLTDLSGDGAGASPFTPYTYLGFTVTTLGIPVLIKLLRAIPAFVSKKPEDEKYEADLFHREGLTLWRAGQFSVLLVALLGVANFLFKALPGLFSLNFITPLLPMALLGITWVAAAAYSSWWSKSLSKDDTEYALANKLAWIVAAVTLSGAFFDVAVEASRVNVWFGTVVAVAFASVFIAVENLPARWSATRVAAWVGLCLSVFMWLTGTAFANPTQAGAYLIGLSLVGASTKLWAKHVLNGILNQATNLVGLLLLVQGLNRDAAPTGTSVTANFLIAVGSSMLFGLLQNFVSATGAQQTEQPANKPALAALGTIPLNAVGGGLVGLLYLGEHFGLIRETALPAGIGLLILLALFRLAVAFVPALKRDSNLSLVRAQSYVGQGLIALTLTVLWLSTDWLATSASAMVVLALAALYHYGFGFLEKSRTMNLIGFAYLEIAVLAAWDALAHQTSQDITFAATLALSLVVAIANDALSNRLSKSTELSRFNLIVLPSLGTLVLGSLLHTGALTASTSPASQWIMQSTLAVATLLGLGLALLPKGAESKLATQIGRCLGASYGIIGFIAVSSVDFDANLRDASLHLLTAAGVWAAGTSIARSKQKSIFWLVASYFGFLSVAQALGNLTTDLLKSDAPEAYSLWYAVLFAACTWFGRAQLGRAATYLMIDVPIVIAAGISLINAATHDLTVGQALHRAAISLAVLAAHAAWRTRGKNDAGWLAYSYAANIALALTVGREIELATKWVNVPEVYSIPLALAFVASALVGSKLLGRVKTLFLVDAPILVALFGSLGYALGHTPSAGDNLHRSAITLALLTAHAAWRSRGRFGVAWLVWGYVVGQGLALAVGRELEVATKLQATPELYAVPAGLALAVISLVGAKQLGKMRRLGVQDAPIILASGISLVYALVHDVSTGDNLLRALVALAALTLLGYWNTRGEQKLQWLGLAYVAGLGLALTVGRELILVTGLNQIIEFYSVPIVASILVANRVLTRIRSFESSLFIWGMPLAGAVLPSAFKAAASFNTTFESLSIDQIIRTVVVLLVSAALLVLGVRRGNLAQTSIGVIGLMVISWVRVQDVNNNLRLESNALLLAFTVWLVLWLVKRFANTGGNSLLYIGLPVAIAMAPSLVTAWAALGHADLTPVDWWRFGVLLAASLVLLTVGSLREQAGMFFPGLVGVISTALPYGFNRISNQSWFLWVLLLLIAGVLVWLAVRLEQMRKVGKESTAWLKSLK